MMPVRIGCRIYRIKKVCNYKVLFLMAVGAVPAHVLGTKMLSQKMLALLPWKQTKRLVNDPANCLYADCVLDCDGKISFPLGNPNFAFKCHVSKFILCVRTGRSSFRTSVTFLIGMIFSMKNVVLFFLTSTEQIAERLY